MLQYGSSEDSGQAGNRAETIALRLIGTCLSYGWLVPLFVWLVLYPFRIWTLGFYHDDWIVLRPPEPEEAGAQATQFASRPVLVLINWAAGYLGGAHPAAWQAIMVLLALGCAFAISMLAAQILIAADRSDREARAAGYVSAAVWLALPWSLGYTAFPTTFNGLVCLIALCACSAIVFSDGPLKTKLWLGVTLTLFHGLTFEAFLGVPVLIVALYAVINRNKRRLLDSQNLWLLGAFMGTQFFLIAYNRVWAWLAVGQNKSFGLDALGIFVRSLVSLPAKLGSALILPGLAFALLVVAVTAGMIDASRRHRVSSSIAILAVAGCCAVMSVMIYALGGYAIEARGLFSRTTFGLSLWLAIGLASVAPVLSSRRPVLSIVSVVSIAGFLIILSASQFRNLQSWRSSWDFEKSVMARFPINDYMAKAQPGRLLVIEAEAPDHEVFGFNAFWDISGALFTAYPQIRQFHPRPLGPARAIATMLNEPRLSSEWNGSSLTQRWCAGPAIWTLAAPDELLVWRYPSPTIDVLRTPTTLGCRK